MHSRIKDHFFEHVCVGFVMLEEKLKTNLDQEKCYWL